MFYIRFRELVGFIEERNGDTKDILNAGVRCQRRYLPQYRLYFDLG